MSDDDNNQKNGDAGKSPASANAAPRRSGFGRGGDSQPPREQASSPAPRPYAPPTDAVREEPRAERPRSERPFRERPATDRDAGGDRPPRKPFRAREDGDAPRKPYEPRGGERSERPAWKPREGDDRPKRSSGGDKPFRARPDGDRPRGPGDGERPRRFERPAGERSFGERSSAGERAASRERPAYRGKDDTSRPKRPYQSRDDRPERDRPSPERIEAPAPREIRVDEPERIAKVMARAGVASRRDSEAMILAGRVTVNGAVIDSPALDVSAKDRITVDGEMLPDRERTRLWLYHKPRGLVTTARDTEGRPTVFEALPEDLPRVITVGRLDINTEGLLLLTNDGGLARVLELPKTGWLRRYRVRAFGEVNQAQLDSLRDGIEIDGEHYGPITARFEREQGANTWLTIDLREGKNREVKRVLEHVGLIVNRLIRVSFGPFQLADLPEGEVDEVRMRVIKDQLGPELAAEAGVDFEAARRDEGPVAAQETPRQRREPEQARRNPREEKGFTRPERGPREDKSFTRPERGPREERAEGRDKPWTKVVWRDPEVDALMPKSGGPPRRGADPKAERAERAATGTAVRKREAAVADPKGRRIQVERVTSSKTEGRLPVDGKPARKLVRARREDFFDESGTRKPRPAPVPDTPDVGERQPWAERGRPARSGGDRPRPPRREEGDRPRGFGSRDAKSRDFKSRDLGSRSDREAAERPSGGKSFGGKPFGPKPSGGKSFGAKSFGAKSFGDKPRGSFDKGSGGKPGGGRPGGPGGRSGGPGRGRPGGGGSRGPRS
jgi:23S rRNA pseudouridine2605 synthase